MAKSSYAIKDILYVSLIICNVLQIFMTESVSDAKNKIFYINITSHK